MGMLICVTHGQQFIQLVSPALRAACIEHRSMLAADLCKVRYVELEGAEEAWFWCDRETARRLALPLERALTEDEYWSLAEQLPLEPACPECLAACIVEEDTAL